MVWSLSLVCGLNLQVKAAHSVAAAHDQGDEADPAAALATV